MPTLPHLLLIPSLPPRPPARPPAPLHRRRARNRRHTRVGEGGRELVLGVGLGLGEILVMGLAWPWGNPRYGSWPWENPRNDFLAILHSKDQHLLNNMTMNL